MPSDSYLLYALIVACEVGFWVILLLALAVRYVLRKELLSRMLLFSLPLIDLLLLFITHQWLPVEGLPSSPTAGIAVAAMSWLLPLPV